MVVQASCRALPRWAWAWAASTARNFPKRAAFSVGQQHSRCYSVPSSSHSLRKPRWRYEVDDAIMSRIVKVREGKNSNTMAMTLNTALPVSSDVFEEALMHLYRKVEALRLCLQERDGQLWVADMDTPKIDFQVVEERSLEDITKTTAQHMYVYNLSEGPLWCARLAVCSPDELCKETQAKGAFPHQYHLVIEMHHAIYDGLCNLHIIQLFVPLLDSVLDGDQIDAKQIGELRGREEARTIEARIRESLEKDPQRLKVLLEENYKTKTRVAVIAEAFGKVHEPTPETYSLLPKVLDDKLSQAFKAKCKAHKVSFNTGFCAVINVALMELVREAGVVRDSYFISNRHPVDTRRYMSDVTSIIWGFHSVQMTQTMTTPWNVKNNFWKYVLDFETKFRDGIKKMRPLEERVLDAMLPPTTPDHTNQTIYDFMITNMYSPQINIQGKGKHVQLTNYYGYTPVDRLEYKASFLISGFQDKVQFQLAYSSGLITRETADKLCNKMVTVFNDIAQQSD